MNKRSLLSGNKTARGWYFAAQETFGYTPAGVVYGQATPDSCVAACARMLLHDAGIHMAEAPLRELLNTSAEGAFLQDLPKALLAVGLTRRLSYLRTLSLPGLRLAVTRGSVVCFVIRPGQTGHALLVDELDAKLVRLRDPLPQSQGRAYSVRLTDFLAVWTRGKKRAGAAVSMLD